MIKIINGDILKQGYDVILHQVNVYGVMASGIAKAIKDKYHIAFEQYEFFCDSRGRREDDLLGIAMQTHTASGPVIIHLFSQRKYSVAGDGNMTDYDALRKCLKTVSRDIRKDYKIGIPYNMSCGIAGGDWRIVLNIIIDELSEHDVTICRL